MKTLFTEQEFISIEEKEESNPDESLTSTKFIEKRNRSGVNNSECQNSSESDNLIICNGEKADNVQTSKTEKHKLSPGIYLQKVLFNSVTQKFRSHSLPNCLEKKKYQKSVSSDKIEDVQEISIPLVNDSDIKEISTDGWFKTWPERTADKILVRNGNELTEENVLNNAASEETDCTIPTAYKISSSIQNSSEVKINIPPEHLSQIKIPVCIGQSEREKDNRKVKCHNGSAIGNSIPLEEILDNIPLAYSPVTKQLLLISTNKGSKSKNSNLNSSYSDIISVTSKNTGEIVSNLEESASEKPVSGRGWSFNHKGLDCDGSSNLHSVSTEVSSFSSTVSSLSDNSPSTNEDSALGSLLDHGDTCSLVSLGSCSAFSEDSIGEKTRKKSLAGFFSKSVFNWKGSSQSEDCNSRNGGGWKIFSKSSSPGSSHTSLSADQYAESDGGSLAPDSPSSVRSGSSSTNKTVGPGLEKRVASSSALIQLARPSHLPAKTPEEDARHRQEYQQMVEAARKRELKEAKLKKKQMQAQLRAEEQQAQASRVWTQEILPRWDQMHSCKKAKDLWWQGVPPCVRGKVWKLAIGNPLHLTHSLYDIYVQRAQDRLRSEKGDCCGSCGADGDCVADSRERSMQQIQLDISRTFPHLCIFQEGGPYYDTLHCLLAAYVCYRPDVGYVQGMSFIAAVFILNMEAADAFVCFANLLNSPCHMAFFHLNQPLMQAYYSTYNELFKHNLPQLYAHFSSTALTPDLYLLDWIYTVFSKAMCLDLACRVWDVFLRDGEQFLFRTALGILHLCQDALLQMDFVHGSQFLTKLPDDLHGDQLFRSISCIKMTVGKATFDDILSVNSIDCH